LNLYVAFNLSRGIWVSFKSFGLIGLWILFLVVQGLLLSRYMVEDDAKPAAGAPSEPGESTQP
jgi:intracellular septation protein